MCCKIPSIVASLSLTDQTADISQTIFTPTVEGVFRLSLYMENDLGSGAGTGSRRTFGYCDDDGQPH